MEQQSAVQPEPYEAPAVVDLPLDGPTSVCAMLVVVTPVD
jgi:hypothetical protein